MSIRPGTRLGPYEVLAPIGAGGMGEVYRALDTKLQREIALKVLPESFSRDGARLARFEREARLLASINHPAIDAIHGLEEFDGIHFLVLELIPGETLEERLARAPLPVHEALRLSHQIAEALEAAHEKGVVHRDLKPANVRVTPEGRAKVLDFGLAKSMVADAPDVSPLATATVGATAIGAIVGTPAYMSPEQARGKPLDERTDVWSFGCLLFEMLAGRRAFGGETLSDCLAAILHKDPDWDALPRATPPTIRRLIVRCLHKDPGPRPRMSEVRSEIGEATAPAQGTDRRLSIAAMGIVGVLIVAATLALLVFRRAPGPAAVPRLSQITLAEGLEQSPAWAPDSRSIAYTTEVGGLRKIFTRRLAESEGAQLTSGDFDDIQPAWSPDGRTIAFVRSVEKGKRLEPGDVFGQYDGGDVWTVDVATRKETRLVGKAFNPSFSPDGGRLAVDASWAGPRRIWITDAAGQNPQQASTDVSEAIAHVRPRWSRDGKRLVFQNNERTKFDVRILDLDTKENIPITSDLFQNIQPAWSPSGRFIYFTSNRTGGVNVWRVAVSPQGQRDGAFEQVTTGPGQDVETSLSADGRLAFSILSQNADLWKLPLDPRTGRPTGPPQQVISTTREDSRGSWSPDGETIAFNSDRTGSMNLWLFSLRDGRTRQLTSGSGGDFQPVWSPDQRTIAFFSSRAGNADVYTVDVATGALRQLTKTPSIDINPAFSPDGRWLAFQSDSSGRLEVWVMGRDGSAPRQLTHVGVTGHFLRWTKDGDAVVFRCPAEGKPVCMEAPLDGAAPRTLPEVSGGSHMSFSPDHTLIMDVLAHKTLWVSPLEGGVPGQVFAFDDPDVRIDYPVWSPDGRWVLFDRFRPQGAAIWLMEGIE